MAPKHATTVWVDLAERGRAETASAFKPKAEAADAAEQIEPMQCHLLDAPSYNRAGVERV